MPQETLTRASLSEAVRQSVGLSRGQSARLVDDTLEEICRALEAGENVKLSGFGTFILRDKRERVGRNPKTGEEVPITARRVLTFRPSQSLRDRVAKA